MRDHYQELLGEAVYSAASYLAQHINNCGIEKQVEFLKDHGYDHNDLETLNDSVPTIEGVYCSHWEEGDVETTCVIDLNEFEVVEISQSDEGQEFDTLKHESVQVYLADVLHTLEARLGKLTDNGKQQLQIILTQCWLMK